MAERCDVHYGKRAVSIDVETKQVSFADGSIVPYSSIISTLPLSTMLDMTGIELDIHADPFTLGVGAESRSQERPAMSG